MTHAMHDLRDSGSRASHGKSPPPKKNVKDALKVYFEANKLFEAKGVFYVGHCSDR